MGKTLPPRVTDAEDAHTTNRMGVREAPIEVITRGERRRIWTPEQKRDIVMESLEPGGSPIAVARRHGIGSGLLCKRRGDRTAHFARQLARGRDRVPCGSAWPGRLAPQALHPMLWWAAMSRDRGRRGSNRRWVIEVQTALSFAVTTSSPQTIPPSSPA